MAGQMPRVSHFEWNTALTHVVYQCVCQSKITATIFRNGQREINIQGSPVQPAVQPVVEGILQGSRFQTYVGHCNFIVHTSCDGTSGSIDVDSINED
ncbi:hypothetical protein BRARA_H02513 [Brassica rapa]|uniref:Uncharacterized protein n=1 Tax=Brassica campestris TaxID=3711 RepID=A0A397YM67_BRACM|nr:hypothetical protein BRARA_H02513 [Brassica rapa]RID51877.1 hypothetical protein BRARA_H02513 [Brassica rapa]